MHLIPQLVNPVFDQTAIDFELLFAGAAHADAGFDARQVGPHPLQSRQRVLELRQLDGQAGFVRLGIGREDVEDQLGPVDDLGARRLFEIARLAGREVVVEIHIGVVMFDERFSSTFPAEVGGHVRRFAPLQQAADHAGPRRFGQAGDFVERVVAHGLTGKNHANEDRLLARNAVTSLGFVHFVPV
jgi:hypothetical protein